MVVPDTNGNFDIGIYPDPTACVFTSQCRYLASTVASGPDAIALQQMGTCGHAPEVVFHQSF